VRRLGDARIWLGALAAAVYLFIYVPLVVLIVFSFNGPPAGEEVRREWVYSTGEWKAFSLEWYARLFADADTQAAFQRSLLIAVSSVLIALVLGTMTAVALYRYRFRGKGLFEQVLYIPLFMPGVIMGISILLLFAFVRFPLGYWSILAAHVAFTLPLVTLVVLARMQRIDWTLEAAAMDLGATPWTAWRAVIFPLLRPGVFAAALLAFPWSFNDFVITFFVAGPGWTTLPMQIYSMAGRSGAVSPRVNALGTLMMAGSLLLVLVGVWLQRRRS